MGKADKEASPRAAGRAVLEDLEAEAARHAAERQPDGGVQRLESALRRERANVAAARLALERERERYGEFFDFAPIGYVTLNATGLILSVNLAAARLLGCERAQLLGMPLLGRVAAEDRRRLLEHLRHCRTTFGLVALDLELPKPAGGTTPVQLLCKRGAPRDANGTILCAVVDMTQREEVLAERRRIEADRQRLEHAGERRAESAAKDRFLAVLSHELRNPLSPILFTVETLERGLVPPQRLQAALSLIRRNLDLEVRLIDDLLDVSRIAHGKLTLERQVVDFDDVVRDVVDGAAAEIQRAELALTLELAAAHHRVDGDPTRLRQVVWNLLSNAIRNTPPQGRIHVRTQDVGDCVALTVRDSGRGVAAHRLEKIFEPFDQIDPVGRRRGGLGLGLAICRGIVEAHGGSVTAASAGPDQGATFTVMLPTVGAQPRAQEGEPVITMPMRRLRVLVVDDDPDAAEAMATVLDLRGHDVAVAHSVAEGLAVAREPFDVLVSDIGLPDGTGVDLMATLQQRGEVRGIAISGFGTREDVQASLAGGFERHLTKPIHLDELIDVIEHLAH